MINAGDGVAGDDGAGAASWKEALYASVPGADESAALLGPRLSTLPALQIPARSAFTRWNQAGFSVFFFGYSLFSTMLMTVLLPTKVGEVTSSKHQSAVLGLAVTAGNALVCLCNPVVGLASDHVPMFGARRKPYFILGLLFTSGFGLWLHYAHAPWQAVLLFSLSCIGTSLCIVAFTAAYVDVVPDEVANQTGALVSLLNQLGGVVGSVLVVVGFERLSTLAIYLVPSAFALAAGLVSAVSFTDSATAMPKPTAAATATTDAGATTTTTAAAPRAAGSLLASVLSMLRHGPFLALLVSGFCSYAVQIISQLYALYYLQQLQLDDPTALRFGGVVVRSAQVAVGILFFVLMGSGVIATVLCWFIAPGRPLHLFSSVAVAMLAPMPLVFALRPPQAFALILGTGAVFGFGTGVYISLAYPLLMAVLRGRTQDSTSPDQFGVEVGIWTVANLLPLAVMPLLVGYVLSRLDGAAVADASGPAVPRRHLGFTVVYWSLTALAVVGSGIVLLAKPVPIREKTVAESTAQEPTAAAE